MMLRVTSFGVAMLLVVGCVVAQSGQSSSVNPFTRLKAKHATGRSVQAASGEVPKVLSLKNAPVIMGTTTALLSKEQRNGLYAIISTTKQARFYFDATLRVPVHIEGEALSLTLPISTESDATKSALNFMETIAPLLAIKDAASEFNVRSVQRDELGKTHVRVSQIVNGVAVFGCDAVVHFNQQSVVEAYNGRTIPTPQISTTAQVAASVAVLRATVDVEKIHAVKQLSETVQSVLDYKAPQTQLVVFPSRLTGVSSSLAWHVTVRPDLLHRVEYFVDATSGEILFSFNNTCSDGPQQTQATDLNSKAQTVHSYLFQNNNILIDASRPMFSSSQSRFPNNTVGTIWTLDARRTDLQDVFHVSATSNAWSDRSSVSAHTNSAFTYEYFRQVHARNAIDGKGGTIISVIHVTEGGKGMDNAFWNGKLMAYGDGNLGFKPLAGGLDVAAHEMTHGVTENTAALVYLSQSGAINESMSDVFGCMVDRNNWLMGEDVVKTTMFPTGALRNLENPHNGGNSLQDNGWQPSHMNEYQKLPETQNGDNGGVHVNSGIPNRAAFLLAQAIGREKTEKIYYRTLANYLTQNSQFIDLRRAVVRSAQELFGATEATAAGTAFDGVGITDGSGSTGPKDQQPVVGTEWILLHNTDFTADQNSLYIVKPDNPTTSDYHPITRTKLNRKPSVVDDGSFAVFVAEDNTIHTITLSISNPQERIISSDPVWDNVAISRDGKRIAAISTEEDSSIYVYDLSGSTIKGQRFYLYTPTTGQGVRNYTIPYADALEWDFSGKFVLFDSFNRVDNNQGDKIEYWNIGMIRVFDPSSNQFSDGLVLNLLPALDQGTNVGNPTFSKNSPHIIAFDLFNTTTSQYAVVGWDLNENAGALVFNNNALGYPSYSKNDDKIAFATTESSRSVVKQLSLRSDKVSPASTTPVFIAADAEYPVYYTTGSRPVSVQESSEQAQPQCFPNPAQHVVTIVLPQQEFGRISICDVLGTQRITHNATTMATTISLAELEQGTYSIRIETAQGVYSQTLHIVR